MEGDVRVSGEMTSGDAVAWIGVASPSSPHRLESVRAGVFHIGRGAGCHLRLGDACIPERLALIVADRHSARVSCQSSSLPLLLNGEPVQDAPLHDGDILEAGPYTLMFRRIRNAALAAPADTACPPEPDGLTSGQLVLALESELETVQELERTPEDGVRELLQELAQKRDHRISGGGGDSSLSDADPAAGERHVIPIDDVASLLRLLEKGQQELRQQQQQILSQLAVLQCQQDHLTALLDSSSDDAVVPLPAAKPRRASA